MGTLAFLTDLLLPIIWQISCIKMNKILMIEIIICFRSNNNNLQNLPLEKPMNPSQANNVSLPPKKYMMNNNYMFIKIKICR